MSSARISCFTVLLNVELCSDWLFHSATHQQEGNYIFKYFLLQLYRRVIILYIKRRHQWAVINTRGIETAFEWSVNRNIVSLSRDAMHKLCLYYGATVPTTHFTRSDACQWCSGSVNHSPSSSVSHLSLLSVYVVSEILCTVTGYSSQGANHVPLVARVILLERVICFQCLSE